MSELPLNWSSSKLEELFIFVVGGDWGKDSESADEDYVDVLCIRGSEFKHWKTNKGKTASVRKIKKSSLETRKLYSGDILIEISGGGPDQPVGRTVLIDDDSLAHHKELDKVCTNFLRLARPNSHINSAYLNYYLQNFYNTGEITNYQGGSNNLRNLKFKEYVTISIPIAPLNEQIRIADKLDSVLAKVDAAQARLEKIPTLLKRFRQSVLAAATSGELTREWRVQNGIGLTDWKQTIFSEISREITVGFVGKMSDKYQELGVKFLRSQNVRAFRFNPENLLYISEDFHMEIYKSRLEAGDLAIVRSGAPGTTCVIPEELGDANCSDLVIVRPNDQLLPEYGCVYMNSSVAQQNVIANQVGVAQQHFNVGSMKNMPISLPSIPEQQEIVRRVESLFTLADTVEKQYLEAKKRLDRLTQSLLAKAFRGELVPQDPNDEPAAELLKRIQAERNAQPPVKNKRKQQA